MTGATATESLPDQNLGLMVFLSPANSCLKQLPPDADNYLVSVQLKNGVARWYIAAAWDQEGKPSVLPFVKDAKKKNSNATLVFPSRFLTKREQFIDYARRTDASLTQPAKVSLLSTSATPQNRAGGRSHPEQAGLAVRRLS